MTRLKSLEYITNLFAKDGYTVLSSEYTHSKQKIYYKCPNNHEHSMRLDHWCRGIRCPYCSNMFKKSISYIKPFFEKDGYKLLSTEYNGADIKLNTICPAGHEYLTSWHNWCSGHRCPICSGYVKINAEDLLKSEGYTLLNTYISADRPVECICPNNHIYKVSVANFKYRKSRCTECSGNGSSSGELIIKKFLLDNNVEFLNNDKQLIKPYELDIVIPDKKVAIEYCGLYWHSELNGKDRLYHYNKMKMCNDAGYRLITIFEDELMAKRDIVFSRLNNIIINKQMNLIYARKCIIKNISSIMARNFCNDNHLQGYGGGSYIKLGIFHNNDLVSVMTFAKPSLAKGSRSVSDMYELHRFCSLKNTVIVGGASKLLKFFKCNYTWKVIFSYADRRWSEGSLYNKLGFDFINYTKPNYWYLKGKKRVYRFALRKNKNDDQFLTEWENRVKQGYDRIWDCGNIKYEIKNI